MSLNIDLRQLTPLSEFDLQPSQLLGGLRYVDAMYANTGQHSRILLRFSRRTPSVEFLEECHGRYRSRVLRHHFLHR
jgi:hypothetical protein